MHKVSNYTICCSAEMLIFLQKCVKIHCSILLVSDGMGKSALFLGELQVFIAFDVSLQRNFCKKRKLNISWWTKHFAKAFWRRLFWSIKKRTSCTIYICMYIDTTKTSALWFIIFDSEIHFLKLPCTYFHHRIWNCNR